MSISIRSILPYAASVAMCVCFAPAFAQQAITTPILTSDQNFRDLAGISASNGGTGFADTTSHNGVMRTGIFYRSFQLYGVSDADFATLSSLRIGLDIDLRTPSEIASAPDRVPTGAAYVNHNIYGTPAPAPVPTLTSPAVAIAYMTSSYQGFVTEQADRAALHEILIDLASAPFTVLYHCSGGKDRTGWTSAILETIAGVSPATIMNDYLASNSYTAVFITTQLQQISAAAGGGAAGAQAAANYAPMVGVQSSFLQAALDQVTASYGSMQAYLTQGLGLTQADIYVLRAKMVDYLTLPGQGAFAANAASGATFLNALQNSPLSGHYTAYNYYLQSAIDAGTLGGVETQVGGQVHADAASYLSRQPLRIDEAIAPYASGRDLGEGRTRIWLAGLGGYLDSDGRAGVADSTERDAGTVIGATHRIDERTSAYLAIGGDWGSVGSAGAHADVTTVLAAVGARYGFSTLEAGPYVAVRADVGWVGYDSRRALGGGLGSATGNTNGAVYGGRVDLGDVIRLAPVTITPQAGFRIAHVSLGSFNESGSDLALSVNGIDHTSSSLLADLDVSLDSRGVDDWTIAPDAALGFELALGHPQVESTGSLDGFTVSEVSAYNSRYLIKGGLGITAQHDAFTVKAGVNAVHGAGSTGINAQLSISHAF